MANIILEQKKAYRKGMVLGFTMAEIAIMLLFCILLAMAFVVDKQEHQITEAKAELAKTKDEITQLVDVKEAITLVLGTLRTEQEKQQFFLELRRVKDSAKQVQLLQETLQAKAGGSGALEPIWLAISLGKGQGLTDKEIVTRLVKDAEYGRAIREGLKGTPYGAKKPDEVAGIVRLQQEQPANVIECQALRVESERLKGQVANIQGRMSSMGRGTEMPACWASPGTGRPEYIFQVDLTSAGLVVHDQKVPHREAEQAQLPISEIQFETPLSREAFSSQTNGILEWSRNNNCRFFVLVKDMTGSSDKDHYKGMLSALEAKFYKLEVR
jgi:hypothetical protein